jgi:hypothetical protein
MSRLSASPSQDPGASSPPPGFLLERGRFKPVVPPPGLEDLDPQGIAPLDLNDRGQIVGPYVDLAAEAARGVLLTRGRLVKVDVPGARPPNPRASTTAARSWATAAAIPPPRRSRGSFVMPGGG